MEPWFRERREEMTGFCQCGCSRPSSKNSEEYFRHSAAHIFPKNVFRSIRKHPMNWVERAFWGGCHTNMDTQSIEKWPDMADWPLIKERYYILAPLLTDQEKTRKFYHQLTALVYLH